MLTYTLRFICPVQFFPSTLQLLKLDMLPLHSKQTMSSIPILSLNLFLKTLSFILTSHVHLIILIFAHWNAISFLPRDSYAKRGICRRRVSVCVCVCVCVCLSVTLRYCIKTAKRKIMQIGRVSYIRIYLCYFCFRWKTVSLVQASLQYLMHNVTISLQQSKITLQNNCINNTSITQPTLSFYFWLKM